MSDIFLTPRYDFKICVLGAGRVGKTSLVRAFFGDSFVEKHVPTVDDYFVHGISLDGIYHNTCIVDTGGTYSFPVMRRLAIETSQGFLVVYALDCEKSFQEALQLLDEISSVKLGKHTRNKKVIVNVVATKLDVDYGDRKISAELALNEIKKRDWITGQYSEVSAKVGFRVMLVFHSLLRSMITERLAKEKKKGRTRLARKMRSYRLVRQNKKKKMFHNAMKSIVKCAHGSGADNNSFNAGITYL